MRFDPVLLDQVLKITQILFYLVAGIVAILTYRKAKDTLLNTVNTEYQKKVIARLEELAKELADEFDSNSPNYWARHDPICEFVAAINETYLEEKEDLEKLKHYPYGYPYNASDRRIRYILDSIKSDPFIPKQLRDYTIEVLQKRHDKTLEIRYDAFDSYFKSLLKGKKMLLTDGTDRDFDKFHNKIIEKLNKNECGITAIEQQAHDIRSTIQEYLESYNPVKRKWSIKRRA